MKCIFCQEEAGNGLDECWWCFCKRTHLGLYRKRHLNELLMEKEPEEEENNERV